MLESAVLRPSARSAFTSFKKEVSRSELDLLHPIVCIQGRLASCRVLINSENKRVVSDLYCLRPLISNSNGRLRPFRASASPPPFRNHSVQVSTCRERRSIFLFFARVTPLTCSRSRLFITDRIVCRHPQSVSVIFTAERHVNHSLEAVPKTASGFAWSAPICLAAAKVNYYVFPLLHKIGEASGSSSLSSTGKVSAFMELTVFRRSIWSLDLMQICTPCR